MKMLLFLLCLVPLDAYASNYEDAKRALLKTPLFQSVAEQKLVEKKELPEAIRTIPVPPTLPIPPRHSK